MSPHFDPKKHLKRIGLANQTTMYKKETQAIGRLCAPHDITLVTARPARPARPLPSPLTAPASPLVGLAPNAAGSRRR